MTLNHCLFLVHIDISIISVSLHLRIKRSDLCVISKLQLNKNDLKRRVKRERDRPKRLYKIPRYLPDSIVFRLSKHSVAGSMPSQDSF